MILLLINTTKALSVLQKVEGKVKFRLKSRKLSNYIHRHLNVQDWRIKLISTTNVSNSKVKLFLVCYVHITRYSLMSNSEFAYYYKYF